MRKVENGNGGFNARWYLSETTVEKIKMKSRNEDHESRKRQTLGKRNRIERQFDFSSCLPLCYPATSNLIGQQYVWSRGKQRSSEAAY